MFTGLTVLLGVAVVESPLTWFRFAQLSVHLSRVVGCLSPFSWNGHEHKYKHKF